MNQVDARTRDFFDRQVLAEIKAKYGFNELDAIRSFLLSETYQMLVDPQTEVYSFSPLLLFDMWESEMITGDPRNSRYIRED